jgi:predicted RNase H-like nuclease (RuvC/YqgF family)
MTKPKLRKKAEINPAQSPHDGIHTCSKGCKKPGCNRTLRDTIEEQDKQIEALKRDVLEKTAELRNLKEVVHDLRISAEDDLDSIDTAREEIARLKAEVERLTANRDILTLELKAITCEMEIVVQAAIRENNLDGWTINYAEDLGLLRKRFDEVRSQLNAAKEGKQP